MSMLSLLPTPENRGEFGQEFLRGEARNRVAEILETVDFIVDAAKASGAFETKVAQSVSAPEEAVSVAVTDNSQSRHPAVTKIVENVMYADFGSPKHQAEKLKRANELAQPADIRDRLLAPTDMELKDAA
jgi:hypothetical protein